jgi:diguanylate cyclase
MSEKKSFETARETLKQLTARKLAPTPGNYKSIYNEIAGIPSVEHFPAQELRTIATGLQAKTPGQLRQKGLLESAIDRMNWDGVQSALVAYSGFSGPSGDGNTAPAPLSGSSPLVESTLPFGTEFLTQMGRLIEYVQWAMTMTGFRNRANNWSRP